MKVDLLRVRNLRCFADVTFEPGPGINWVVGSNGAGKTTLLEAVYILAHGRSFRSGGRSAPCRRGEPDYTIYAEVERAGSSLVRLGLTRSEDRWLARRNGEDLDSLAPLFEACPVVHFGPDSQDLVLGPADGRRAWLDWSVFHVEHTSLRLWKAWRRALRQRNALLRDAARDADFEPWEHDLGRLAGEIHALRSRCVSELSAFMAHVAARLVPELGEAKLDYRAGWDEELGLAEQLARTRDRDRERGYTWHGAHRADWSLMFANVPQREYLSRGQAKSVAMVCTLALVEWFERTTGGYPLLCIDDLESELDARHVVGVMSWLAEVTLQTWLTRTSAPVDAGGQREVAVFHVEHGHLDPARG